MQNSTKRELFSGQIAELLTVAGEFGFEFDAALAFCDQFCRQFLRNQQLFAYIEAVEIDERLRNY